MYEVVYADRFIALGWRIEQGGNVVRAILWTSGDGRDWKRTRSVEIGDCSGEGPACGHADGLVATEGGLVIIGDVAARGENGFFGALASTDGGDWTRIDRATFGGDPNAYISAAMPWKDGVVALVGSGDGPMSAWLTNDGVAWEQVGTLGEGIQSIGALATNGEVLVAAEGESAPEGFRTTLWTARDGEQFRRAGAFDGLILTKLAYVGDTGFVAVGHDEGRPQVVASTEGRSWYRAVPGLPQIECAPWWLAGGPLTALYVGSCGAWIAHAG